MALDIILRKGYNNFVDLWSLGSAFMSFYVGFCHLGIIPRILTKSTKKQCKFN